MNPFSYRHPLVADKHKAWEALKQKYPGDKMGFRREARSMDFRGEGIYCNQFKFGYTHKAFLFECYEFVHPATCRDCRRHRLDYNLLNPLDVEVETFRDILAEHDGKTDRALTKRVSVLLKAAGIGAQAARITVHLVVEAVGATLSAFHPLISLAVGASKIAVAVAKTGSSAGTARPSFMQESEADDAPLSFGESMKMKLLVPKRKNGNQKWVPFAVHFKICDTVLALIVGEATLDEKYPVSVTLEDPTCNCVGATDRYEFSNKQLTTFIKCILVFILDPDVGVLSIRPWKFNIPNTAHVLTLRECVDKINQGYLLTLPLPSRGPIAKNLYLV